MRVYIHAYFINIIDEQLLDKYIKDNFYLMKDIIKICYNNDNMIKDINKLKEIIAKSRKIVIFSGAGLSTASGIPDFRSNSGLYNQKSKYNVSPEEIISHHYYKQHPGDFFKYYFENMVYLDALPNIAHRYFAELEKEKEVTIVTQNIDNLHQLAGSNNVIELHGSVFRNYCEKCGKYYSIYDINRKTIPRCVCGGIIKPDVVLYEESLNENDIYNAINAIATCDTLIVVGTSLVVYPAASFIRYYQGNNLVLINKSITQYDNIANLVFHEDIVKVIEELKGE